MYPALTQSDRKLRSPQDCQMILWAAACILSQLKCCESGPRPRIPQKLGKENKYLVLGAGTSRKSYAAPFLGKCLQGPVSLKSTRLLVSRGVAFAVCPSRLPGLEKAASKGKPGQVLSKRLIKLGAHPSRCSWYTVSGMMGVGGSCDQSEIWFTLVWKARELEYSWKPHPEAPKTAPVWPNIAIRSTWCRRCIWICHVSRDAL